MGCPAGEGRDACLWSWWLLAKCRPRCPGPLWPWDCPPGDWCLFSLRPRSPRQRKHLIFSSSSCGNFHYQTSSHSWGPGSSNSLCLVQKWENEVKRWTKCFASVPPYCHKLKTKETNAEDRKKAGTGKWRNPIHQPHGSLFKHLPCN